MRPGEVDRLRAAELLWSREAQTFDQQPDHGLLDSSVRAAWAARLQTWLPHAPARVLDVGCGTGSLAVLAAELGHRVTGMDMATGMLRHARQRPQPSENPVEWVRALAQAPPFATAAFDVAVARHLLWALDDPAHAVATWLRLLRPAGRLVLIEGQWGNPEAVGIAPETLAALVTPYAVTVELHALSSETALWGREVHDERYALVARIVAPGS